MQRLESTIEEVRWKWVLVQVAEGVALLGAYACLGLLVAFALDNLLHLSLAPRLVLTGVVLAGSGWIAWTRLATPLLKKPSDDAVALLIERGKPELENRLINAVQLSRETLPDGSVGFVDLVRQDAAQVLARLGVQGVVPIRLLRRAGAVACAAAGVLAFYALALPRHFHNACERYANPMRFVAPLTETTLTVEPGHVRLARGAGFTVVARVGGVVPTRGVLEVRGPSDGDYEMQFRGEAFTFDVSSVLANMTYRVLAGDAESEEFRVQVVDPPRVERLVLDVVSPRYARRPVDHQDPAAGPIRAIVDSVATITARADRPLGRATIRLGSGASIDMSIHEERIARANLPIRQRDSYAIVLVDREGLADPRSQVHPIEAAPDGPPVVELREPGRDLRVATHAEVPLSVHAKDDVGLAHVQLLCRVEPGGEETTIAEWSWADVKQEVTAGHLLGLARWNLRRGMALTCRARAVDLKGQETMSKAFTLSILSEEEEKEQALSSLSTLRDRLRWILEKQKQARGDLAKGLASRANERQGLETARRVRSLQSEVRQQSLAVLADWRGVELSRLPGRERLAAVSADEMARAVEIAEAMERARTQDARVATGKGLLPVQDRIVAVLEAILGSLSDLIARVKSADDASEVVAKATEEIDARRKLEDLAAKLEEFIKSQKKAIQASQELDDKHADDFTEADRLRLEELRATEEKWGKFLQEAGTDLSKLPPQDFSNGSVAKELIEAASQVELAADALSRKNVELAVPYEQSGLELAEEITMNIERWLADVPDKIEWNMEEPTGDYDVPMADLPEELEDLVGELIDREEEMTEETEDVTSSWMDSLNEGAGWTAFDGPISNMSAKGITGNLQPNSQEVGGRSGEGRSGKSSGQMVEETAQGKGGRQTPSRSTPDPYEAGQVKDTSTDPTGGSTGGGKVSGVNQEGLRGAPPPDIQRQMARLANQQAEIRQQAERIEYGLDRRNYQSDDLSRAIELMKEMERDLARQVGRDYGELQRRIVERLSLAKKVVGAQVRANQDTVAHLPKRLRDELESAMHEEAPAEYRDLIEDYYKNLSEGK